MFASKYLKTVLIIFFIFLFQNINFAHCDSMEGPVVKAAKQSLESGNINHVLIWVKPENEQEIKDLFQKALHVRGLDKDAKELADKYFFETIVRVHRMGEGVAYTGIKPAGYKPEKGIEEADIAVEKNNLDNLLKGLKEDDHAKVKELFQKLQAKKDFQVNNVQSGREYVESYVHFIHYVEGLYTGKEESHDAHKHH